MPQTKTGHVCGEDHYESKLTADLVRKIRAHPEIGVMGWVRKIWRDHGIDVSRNAVSDALNEVTWKNVTPKGHKNLWGGDNE